VAITAVVGLLVLLVELDALHSFFRTTDLTIAQWSICLIVGSTILSTGELVKLLLRTPRPRQLRTRRVRFEPLTPAPGPAALPRANAHVRQRIRGAGGSCRSPRRRRSNDHDRERWPAPARAGSTYAQARTPGADAGRPRARRGF
jgi:hypothetical protein